ncbi:DMT family transporter [Exiguobacterium sp. SH3S2]|nr:DMT family transporter [Exiguobacterium sp. SH5S4]TCI46342.1 DMT family transporter [Exiguobacterium sp. SH3S3]TCI57069.1 DMT family transporter [Exiguobacterium sp. SH5S13]TCI61983.1 DMT family transporter [Exiguobacterium sp. SH3S2]
MYKTKGGCLLSYLILFAAVFFLSTSVLFVKWTSAPAETAAFYRMLFSSLMLLPFLDYRSLFSLRSNTRYAILLSGTLLAFHFWLWFLSLDYTTVASSTLFVTSSPIFVLIGNALFFKKHPTRKGLAFALVAVLGGMLVAAGDIQIGRDALYGDVLALLAALLIAGYWLVGQHIRTEMKTNDYSFSVYFVATFVLGFMLLVRDTTFVGFEGVNWWYFIALAFFPTLLGHNLFNYALARVSATVVSITILGEALWGMLFGFVFFEERLGVMQWIGAAVLLGGIYLFLKEDARSTRTDVVS